MQELQAATRLTLRQKVNGTESEKFGGDEIGGVKKIWKRMKAMATEKRTEVEG